MYLVQRKKKKELSRKEQTENCAKNRNSNFCTINQMSHIHQFFVSCLPGYYLQLVAPKLTESSFLLPNSQTNLYEMTADFILAAQRAMRLPEYTQSPPSLAHFWHITYSQLRNARMTVQENDNNIIKYLKSQLKYVHHQILQILVRMLLIYQMTCFDKELTSITARHIQEITFIYPALKIEIDFSDPNINLHDWFASLLEKIAKQGPLTNLFKKALEKIAKGCSFTGALQRTFERYYRCNLNTSESKPTLDRDFQRPLAPFSGQSRENSQIKKDNTSQRQSSLSCQRRDTFNDLQTFRKKKRIVKERFKAPAGGDTACKTPIRQITRSRPSSPTTQNQGSMTFTTRSDTTENNASSILYRKMKNNITSNARTLYYGETKFFVPKKNPQIDPEEFLGKLRSPFISDETRGFENLLLKRVQRRPSRANLEPAQNDSFCVPETPRPNHLKRLGRTGSTDHIIDMPPLKL